MFRRDDRRPSNSGTVLRHRLRDRVSAAGTETGDRILCRDGRDTLSRVVFGAGPRHHRRSVVPGHSSGSTVHRRPGTRRDHRGALSPGRTARTRRHGRGVSRRRPHARSAGRPEVPAGRRRDRRCEARPVPQRAASRAPGVAQERLPPVRPRRRRRAPLPDDGVRRRRGSRRRCSGGSAGSRRTRRSSSRASCAPASPRPTSAACCTAI